MLDRHSPALYLIQSVRDEAHRFAITFHRHLRSKQTIRSQLEEIPGVGPKRRTALFKAFGSLEAVKKASVEELAAVDGMNHTAAQTIYEWARARKKLKTPRSEWKTAPRRNYIRGYLKRKRAP